MEKQKQWESGGVLKIDQPEMFCKKNLLTRKQQLERKKLTNVQTTNSE